MTFIACKEFFYRGKVFNVHIERIVQGWTGYIIHDGEYFLSLPTEATERELMARAEKRVRETLDKQG